LEGVVARYLQKWNGNRREMSNCAAVWRHKLRTPLFVAVVWARMK
jgi:hypothetical protein